MSECRTCETTDSSLGVQHTRNTKLPRLLATTSVGTNVWHSFLWRCCHVAVLLPQPHAADVKEAKQLEEARLKLVREQKKRLDMEAAARLAAQRKAAEQAARQQAEADMRQKKADRQSRVCHPCQHLNAECMFS